MLMALDTTTIDRLKEKLLAEKERLESELGRLAKPTGVAGEYETQFENIGTDTDENATEVEDYADKLAVEGTLETELKEVSAALAKMDAGTYGVCEKTGQDIPVERLEAYPAARTLVDA
ncbi:MAG: TraR/DksA C4-type zinc finger protein [Candidatus Moraniibacteriota bacterium]|nr:MAG: TraR/DksA C4-type zinc finger protein [Candidatus Moranbacteria bacterium]